MLTKLARAFVSAAGIIDETPDWFFKFKNMLRYGKRAYRVGSKIVGDTAAQGQSLSYANPRMHKYLKAAVGTKKDDKNDKSKQPPLKA